MANMIPNSALYRIFNTYMGGKDIRARLCMTNTTCDTDQDAITDLADYTTIDPGDATGAANVAVDTETIVVNDATNSADFDGAADLVFSGLGGNATRDYQGVLLYEHVDGTNANDLPLAFIDFTADIPKAATQVTVPISTTLIAVMTQG